MSNQLLPIMLMMMMMSSSSSCVLYFMGGLGGSGGFLGGFTSALTNPFGSASDLFNLAVNGHKGQEASPSEYCEIYCGNCSEADFEKWVSSGHVASAADARALCEGNRSNFSGSQDLWDAVMDKTSGGCCP